MNYSADAAEQIVRMSLEGVEVAAKITGNASRDVAALIAASMNGDKVMIGETNLTKLIKTGKPLTVFSLQEKDIAKFQEVAKQYGVVYTIIKDKENNPNQATDIITRTEDAPKINRIIEKFKLATIDDKKSPNQEADRKPVDLSKQNSKTAVRQYYRERGER